MNRRLSLSLFILFCNTTLLAYDLDDKIVINKHNVTYVFVPFDARTDTWIRNVFPHWEQETFDVFDRVKNIHGIAIDLGAWIGTTAIWLSKHFSQVIAVEADKVSLQCLSNNLGASVCANVRVCDKAIAHKPGQVIFGPRGNQFLNDSMSCIKEVSDVADDYVVQAITFEQLIDTYVKGDVSSQSKHISFIKCDIEGGEETIIEDILYFAYYHKAQVYLSFHLGWWKSKKITDFAHLFRFFKTDCPEKDICAYLQAHPLASLLFEPLENAGEIGKRGYNA